MNRPPLIRRDLDAAAASCDVPGCDHTHRDGLPLHATCHPTATLQVWYRDGILTVKCGACQSDVCHISVASVFVSVH